MNFRLWCLLCMLTVLSATDAYMRPLWAQSRKPMAFVHVNVILLDPNDILTNRTVLVHDGRIAAIGAADSMILPRDVVLIDATGQYLIPGLIELNGHVPHPADVDEAADRLRIYVAHGVTTVRGAQTHQSQTKLQRRVDDGDLMGPRLILTTGDSSSRNAPFGVLRELSARAETQANGTSLSPYAQLRRVTIDAAISLGIDAEAGLIAIGKRADLLLLTANPLERIENVTRIAGVMLHGRWLAHTEIVRAIEGRAKDLVFHYYAGIPVGSLASACQGLTLHDCFNGDGECASETRCSVKHLAYDRGKLLDRLELLAMAHPRSDWITGQRVNFALKHREIDRAVAIAESCVATSWWCQALRGYALHNRRAGDGESQLDSAFYYVPSREVAWATPFVRGSGDRGIRCEWTDVSTLIEGSLRTEYERLPCGVNRAFESKFWWLADPLWSVPGNERRVEQVARNIAMRLHDEILRVRSRSGHHPHTHHALVMPGGLPNSYRTEMTHDARQGTTRQRRVPYVYGGYSFAPDSLRFRDPMQSTSKDWELKWDDGHERMVTREKWYNLEHQTAVLHRGERLRVLAAAPLPLLLPSFDGVEAFLAMGRPSDRRIAVVPAPVEQNGTLRASIDLDRDAWLASIEVVADTFRARARHAAPAPALTNGFGLSDLVLVHQRFERDRMTLLDAMLPSTILTGREQVGIYVEVYGVEADEPLRITLSGTPINRSLLQRLAGAVGLDRGAPLNVAWLEPAGKPDANMVRRFFALDLTSLQDGDYRLLLNVVRANGVTATAQRDIRIELPR